MWYSIQINKVTFSTLLFKLMSYIYIYIYLVILNGLPTLAILKGVSINFP